MPPTAPTTNPPATGPRGRAPLAVTVVVLLGLVITAWISLGGWQDAGPAVTREQALVRLAELGEKFDGAVQNRRDTSPLRPQVQRLVELWPDLPEGWTLLGQVSLDLILLEDAVAAFDRALELDDENPGLHLLAGAAAELIEKPREAQAHYERARELQPDRPETLIRLANLAFKQERLDDSAALIGLALEHRAGYHEALALRSALHETRGDLDAAIADLERAYRSQREVGGETLRGYALRLAQLLCDQGDPMAAARTLRLPKPEDFFQPDVMAAHAEALAAAGYAFEAGQYYQGWVDRDPANVDAAAEAVRWYLEAGEPESAGNMIVRLQIIDPRDHRLPGLREQLRDLQEQHAE